MLLTNDQIVESKLHLKTWLHTMQVAAKAAGAPTFTLKGPCMLSVRFRSGRPSGGVSARNHSFLGGEAFKISGVVAEQDADVTDSVTIVVNMIPATATLAKEMSGMTLTLQEAMELFDGAEEFAMKCRIDAIGDDPGRKHSGAPKPKVIRKEDNPMWGAWG